MTRLFSLLFFALICMSANAPSKIKFGVLKYQGGGDWYANPSSVKNLIEFCNSELEMNIDQTYDYVEVASVELHHYPFIHMTGHGNVVFSPKEVENLRTYLLSGGFLHIDDNYGLDPFIRPEMKKVFPELEWKELPFSHPIFHQHFNFENGLPKIHEHDNKPPQAFGLEHNGRLVCLYTYECDLGDGWEDQAVHKDSDETREKALRMGANIIEYIFQ